MDDQIASPACKQSIKLYERAIELDDQFALAYAGIADAYSMLAVYLSMDETKDFPRPDRYVLDAISLNSELGRGIYRVGVDSIRLRLETKSLGKSYRKADQLNPKIAQAHQWLGIMPRSSNEVR